MKLKKYSNIIYMNILNMYVLKINNGVYIIEQC